MSVILTKYELDERDGTSGPRVVVNMRVEEEVTQFSFGDGGVNGEINRDVDIPITVVSNPAPGKLFCRPRGVMIRWVEEPPEGYDPNGRIYIPILTYFRGRAVKVGLTGMYRDRPVIIVSKLPEMTGI